jgi:N-acetylmuramoyl-L-alanine amidase
VIDPGHNGANGSHTTEINRPVDAGGFTKPCNTTGTAGGNYAESTFTWEVAQRLAPQLTALGATVILTRTDNAGWGPCVDARGLTAANHHADLLLSIHADGSGAADHGFHVIHPTSIPGFTDGSAARSAVLATDLRDALVTQGFAPSNYIGSGGLDQRGDLGTLNRAVVPAAMVESGNMRNAADLATLRSADGQSRLVAAFVAGIVAYLHQPS